MSIPNATLLPLRQARRWPHKLVSRVAVMALHGAHSAGSLTIWVKPRRVNLRWWAPGKRQAYVKLHQSWLQATAQNDIVWQARIFQAFCELWPLRVVRADSGYH